MSAQCSRVVKKVNRLLEITWKEIGKNKQTNEKEQQQQKKHQKATINLLHDVSETACAVFSYLSLVSIRIKQNEKRLKENQQGCLNFWRRSAWKSRK